jgi:uncharacterized DUF497 family protein
VEYEWDPAKAAANFKKHRVRFADAALSLEDPLGLSTRTLRASRGSFFLVPILRVAFW